MTGYGSFLGDLNIFKAQCFAIIANKIGELRDEDMRKAQLKMKSKGRK